MIFQQTQRGASSSQAAGRSALRRAYAAGNPAQPQKPTRRVELDFCVFSRDARNYLGVVFVRCGDVNLCIIALWGERRLQSTARRLRRDALRLFLLNIFALGDCCSAGFALWARNAPLLYSLRRILDSDAQNRYKKSKGLLKIFKRGRIQGWTRPGAARRFHPFRSVIL